MDSWNYGKPARGRPFGRSSGRSSGRSLPGGARFVVLGVAVVAVGVVVFMALQAVRGGSKAVADHVEQDVQQVDSANDLVAQSTLNVALTAAKLAFVQDSSYAGADATGLAAVEPGVSYTAEASTGSKVVSVLATDQEWAGAVLSASGGCLYVHLTATQTLYGSGTGCTGQAAMEASAASW